MTKWKYGVHPGVAMVQQWVATLKQKTGRSLEEWLRLIQQQGPSGEAERQAWLKTEYRLGTNSAVWLAQRSCGRATEMDGPTAYLEAAQGYVEAMFAGPKTALLPLFDALMDVSYGLGQDVRACPGQTIIPLYRNHVFAQIKPATRTRIDFGLALGDLPASGRLIDTGGFAKKDRITHRIAIASVEEVDAEVQRWAKLAYDRDA